MMQRYFLEVGYHGKAYSGFQVQANAHSVQAAVQQAFAVLQREPIEMTGSSRTDTGVHARSNFFHFDYEGEINVQFIYKMNAILPPDIVLRTLVPVAADAHCRFDAISRTYEYFIYREKDPFIRDRAFYFPYPIKFELLQEAATILKDYSDFSSFAKRNSQVKTFECRIIESGWKQVDDCLVFRVTANRFLRGMVRGLTGTMLKVGREKITLGEFRQIIESRDSSKADFSVPGHGLFLMGVEYPFPL